MAISTKIDGVTSESQELVDMYLEANEKSKKAIISALRRLTEEINKSDLKMIDYSDYLKYVRPFVDHKAPAKHKRSFIRYLYAYNFLINPTGFEQEYWNPKEIIDNFEREKKKPVRSPYKPALTFEDINMIQQFFSHISEDDFDLIKLELVFYMFFYNGIDNVLELKEADSLNYNNGIWTINGSDYKIPERYDRYLNHIKTLKYTKLYNLNSYIKQLGEQIGIENLKYPKQITKARDQMQISCFQCGEKYFAFNDQWTVINGKILCNNCATKILDSNDVKKNYISDDFQCYEVDILTAKEKLNTEIATNSFKSLQQKAPRTINYKNLNEFFEYIGGLGEKYVYELEKEKLINTEYYDLVNPTPARNHENGYDILSYELDGTPIMIEVKTTTGSESDSFYMTYRELETAKKNWSEGRKYKIYRVSNILSENESNISLRIYEKLSETDFDITGIIYKIKDNAGRPGA